MRERVAEWKRIFDTEENAISKRLSQLAWEVAVFSCVVEMVRQAPEIDGQKRLNGMVIDMLATGFWTGTMQAVRRLVEKEAIRGRRGVCSLGGLIADARLCREQLTREVFVCDIAGLEYDVDAIRARHEAYWNEQLRAGNHSFWVPRDLHYEPSMQRHQEFDWLSGSPADQASRGDIIRVEVFNMLDTRLGRLSGVIDHVNVQIAHAATEASRAGRVLQRWGLSEAKQAVREIAEIAHVVGNWFCFSSAGTVLPHPQFDQFAHLDAPLYTGDRARLQAVWDAFAEEAGSWHRVDPVAWMPEAGQPAAG